MPVPQHFFCHCGLTDEDRHWLTAGTDTHAGHRRHFHLVKHAGHQAFQHCGQYVSVHRLVDVVARLVVTASARTPNLVKIDRVGTEAVIPLSLQCAFITVLDNLYSVFLGLRSHSLMK